jgi:outer membrane receptor protein involved in Fe transport
VRPLGDAFFNDTTHGYRQKAAFASVDLDVIAHILTLTAGTRYFRSESSLLGSSVGSSFCSTLLDPRPSNPCLNQASFDLDALGLRRTYSGFRSRASLSWKLDSAAMFYAAWSQGFRAGGFNRVTHITNSSALSNGNAAANQSYQATANARGGASLPLAYAPDSLTNLETGWRTRLWDGRVQWNGTLYQEDWTHAQVTAQGPEFGTFGSVVNGGTYRVRGFETSASLHLRWLTIDCGAAWSHGRLINQGTYYWNDGTPIDFGALTNRDGSPVLNFSGPLGGPLAGAPPFQGNIRARYEFDLHGVGSFVQVGVVHQAHSLSSAKSGTIDAQGESTAYDLPAFTTLEAAIGVAKGGWSLQAYGDNLTDRRAELFANNDNDVKAVTVIRPRTIGVRVGYKFGT